MGKGASFERKISKQLSLWWSKGLGLEPRDDIFWRSCQSGGRATTRAKVGKATFGSYGDIAAVDPVGLPLLKIFTIELKRGRSHGHPEDLVDCASTKCQRPFEACLMQAIEAHKAAQSYTWLLICQRDRKVPMVYMDILTRKELEIRGINSASYSLWINQAKGKPQRLQFSGVSLENFLAIAKPKLISHLASGFWPH